MLVQAVSLLRQRKLDEVVKSLNNLLAANRVRACTPPRPLPLPQKASIAPEKHLPFIAA